MFSLATAESGMAASNPPTTATKTRRRKPLTASHPFSSGSVQDDALPKAAAHMLSPLSITLRRSGGHVTWQKVTTVIRPSPNFPLPRARGRVGVGAGSAFDRCGDQAPPLRPGAVVVADVR